MNNVCVFCLMALAAVTVAQRSQGPPPEVIAYMESVKRVLPPATSRALEQIERSNLQPMQKAERANAVMNQLPDSVLDRIPLPPPMRQLPQRIQNKFRALSRNRALTFQQRAQEAQRIIMSMTPAERATLPKGMLPN